MSAERVLVVDDERDMAESCGFFLERAGMDVHLAFSGEDALDLLDQHAFDLVVTDLKMPRMTGLSLLDAIKSRDTSIEVLLITGFPEIKSAVSAIKRGAFDYIPKPFDEKGLMERVEKALTHRRVKESNGELKDRLTKGEEGRKLVYRSPVFGEIVDDLQRAAQTDATVLVIGESGTGKELLAHHLHDKSPRVGRPFIPLDCTTIPENLVETELFGHVRGAFTGASRNKAGLFQVAEGGTLFLDEIGELPLSFQPKLLRALQERTVRPVGANEAEDVDVRLVCATNRDLKREVAAGRFREDLFYRLDVVRVTVPPLRDRAEDVPLLAEHFLKEFLAKNPACQVTGITPNALEALAAYQWPGNVRQLANAIERACALSSDDRIRVKDLTDEIACRNQALRVRGGLDTSVETFQEMKTRRVAAMESTYLAELLKTYKGNVTKSAQVAGMTRSAFQKLLQRYGIKSSDYR